MPNSVRIITDSACDLPQTLVDETGIEIVPLTVRFGDEEFIDRIELQNADFWQRLSTSNELPSTAAPSPGAFESAFLRAAEEGCSGVICINLSSKLSATYQAAVAGARAVAGTIDVHVIDSLSCTIAQATLCREAAALASAGEDAPSIAAKVEDLRDRLHLFGTLDNLDNLRKGGRIGLAGAFFASLLSVKPVITIQEGEVKPESRQRTRSRALQYLASLVVSQGPVSHVAVAHSGAPDVNEFVELLAPVARPEDIPISEIGPVIGTHGGPRLIAVSYAKE